MELEVRIARLGAQGDGVADGPDGPLFVPFALAGELVSVEATPGSDRAGLIEVLEPSPDRVAPICPHFGVCGGCALQHLEASAYLAWKRELVVAALRSRGLDAEVDAVRPVPVGSRRRAALALGRGKEGLALGYRRARSHELIDIDVCPILSPRIVARLPKLKQALGAASGRQARGEGEPDRDRGRPRYRARRRQAEPRGAWRLCRKGQLPGRGAADRRWREHRVARRAADRPVRRRSEAASRRLPPGLARGRSHSRRAGKRWGARREAPGRSVCRPRHLHLRLGPRCRGRCLRGRRGCACRACRGGAQNTQAQAGARHRPRSVPLAAQREGAQSL